MRFFTLLLLTFICTCVRAQSYSNGKYPEKECLLKSPPFFALNHAQDLVVLDPGNDQSRVYYFREEAAVDTHIVALAMDKSRIKKISITSDGGLLVAGKKGDELIIEWLTPGLDSSYLTGKSFKTSDKSFKVIDLFRTKKGTTSLFFTAKNKTYQLPLRLIRDTMSEAPRLVEFSPKEIYDLPVTAMTRLPNGRFAGLVKDKNQTFLQYFSSDGDASGSRQQIATRNTSEVQALCFYPRSKGILFVGMNGNKMQWFLVEGDSKRVVREMDTQTKNLSIDKLVVKNDNSVIVLGSELIQIGRNDKETIWLASLTTDLRKGKVVSSTPGDWLGKEMHLLYGDRTLVAGFLPGNVNKLHYGMDATNSSSANTTISFGTATLIDQQGDGVLDAGEAATLEIPWRTGTASARGIIKATIRFRKNIPGLPSTIITHSYPILGEDNGILQFPFYAGRELPTGSSTVDIDFELEGVAIGADNYKLKTRSLPTPDLVFEKAGCFLSYPTGKDSTDFRRLDTLTVHLRIRNQGRDIATSIDLKSLPIPHVIFSEYYHRLIDLAPGERLDTTLQVIPHSYFQYEDLNLNFFLSDGSGKNSFLQLTHKLPHIFLIEEGDRSYLAPRLRFYPNGKRGGPTPYFVPDVTPAVEMIIPRPNSIEENTLESPLFSVPIRFSFLDVENNSGLKDSGSVFLEKKKGNGFVRAFVFSGDDIVTDPLHTSAGQWVYELQTELEVPEKKTIYRIGFTTASESIIYSDLFTITPCDRLQRTLHICLIAPEYDGGEPTRLSVQKMDSLLRSHKIIKEGRGRFFNSVENDTLYTATKASIDEYINGKRAELSQKKTDKNSAPLYHDYFLFYAVSHGIIQQNDFKMITSFHKDSISFAQHLVDELANLPAEKFYILDACYSADAVNEVDSLDLTKLPINKFAVRIMAASADKSVFPFKKTTRFSSVLLRVLNMLLSEPIAPYANDGVVSSEELWAILKPKATREITEWRKKEGKKHSASSFFPHYRASRNLGRPSYVDYFFELPIK